MPSLLRTKVTAFLKDYVGSKKEQNLEKNAFLKNNKKYRVIAYSKVCNVLTYHMYMQEHEKQHI